MLLVVKVKVHVTHKDGCTLGVVVDRIQNFREFPKEIAVFQFIFRTGVGPVNVPKMDGALWQVKSQFETFKRGVGEGEGSSQGDIAGQGVSVHDGQTSTVMGARKGFGSVPGGRQFLKFPFVTFLFEPGLLDKKYINTVFRDKIVD